MLTHFYHYQIIHIFEETMQVTGKICQLTLNGLQGQGTIVLYFLICKLCKIGGYYEAIERVCDMKYHIMPIGLIPVETTINKLGLYTKYILAGAYICKLFDYYNYDQCDEDEKKTGICSDKYAYIGERYINVYPYNELILHPLFDHIYDELFNEETEFKQQLAIKQEKEKIQSEENLKKRIQRRREQVTLERFAHKRATLAQERETVAQEEPTDAPEQNNKKLRVEPVDDGPFQFSETPRYLKNILGIGEGKGIYKNKSKKYRRKRTRKNPRKKIKKTRRVVEKLKRKHKQSLKSI